MSEDKEANSYDIIQKILPQVSELYLYMLVLKLVPSAVDVARDGLERKAIRSARLNTQSITMSHSYRL